LQIAGPVYRASHSKAGVQLRADGLRALAHVADPLVVVVDEDVTIAACVQKLLRDAAVLTLAVGTASDNLVDLGVGPPQISWPYAGESRDGAVPYVKSVVQRGLLLC